MTKAVSKMITKEVKRTLLKALSRGYFDGQELEILQSFLYPEVNNIVIEVIDNRDKVDPEHWESINNKN